MMLLFHIWIQNKENRNYNLSFKKLNKVLISKEDEETIVEISSRYNAESLKKLQKIGLIQLNQKRSKSHIEYLYGKNNNFRNIPLGGYYSWLLNAGKSSGFRSYIYLLFRFYNDYNISSQGFGKAKLNISASDIAKDLKLSKSTIRRHLQKIKKLDLIKVETQQGKNNIYRLSSSKNKDDCEDDELYYDWLENKDAKKKDLQKKYGKDFKRLLSTGRIEKN